MIPIPIPVSTVFPPEVRQRLIQAVAVEAYCGPGESVARKIALEKAELFARRQCPHLFKKEPQA